MAQKKVQKITRSPSSSFIILFFGVLIVTLVVYILRGMGILSFLPGGILLILIALSLLLGLFYGIDKTRRF